MAHQNIKYIALAVQAGESLVSRAYHIEVHVILIHHKNMTTYTNVHQHLAHDLPHVRLLFDDIYFILHVSEHLHYHRID